MGGAVHALIGAAIGSLFKSKSGAFTAGVASHIALDMIPHKDCHPAAEVAMMGVAMAGVAKLRGIHSPEFWGAIGGVSPDSEHALLVSGLITQDQEVFPTHVENGKNHGPDSNERLSQILLAATAICFLALHKSDEQDG